MTETKLNVSKYKKLLMSERARLVQESHQVHGRDKADDQGDEFSELSDYDNHPADTASETFEREKDLALNENTGALIHEIDRALEKIEAGTYGVCDRCGTDISKARLEALPQAVLCIECQDIVEGR